MKGRVSKACMIIILSIKYLIILITELKIDRTLYTLDWSIKFVKSLININQYGSIFLKK